MYAGGSTDRVVELLTDDIVWHVPGASQIAGDHRGHDGVIEYFSTRRRIAEVWLVPIELQKFDRAWGLVRKH